jgi:hypothetical protein
MDEMDDHPSDGFVVTMLVFAAIGTVVYVLAGIGAWTVIGWLTGG